MNNSKNASFSAGFPAVEGETLDRLAASKFVFFMRTCISPYELLEQSQFGYPMTQAVGD